MNIALRFYLQNLQKAISYRAEFWIGFLGSVGSQFVVAFFMWKAIFQARGAETLQGYTFGGLMLYYLLVPLVERVGRVHEMGGISGEIYDGGLSRYLLYPIPYFRIHFAANLAQSTVYLGQMVLMLAAYFAIFGRPEGMDAAAAAKGFGAMMASAALCFWMSACVEMVAFWADNVWSLWVLIRILASLLGGGMIPLAFFPEWSRALLEYLPFGRLISFPVRCLLGQVGWGEWALGMGVSAAWAGVFLGAGMILWKRGLRTYAGVGI